MPHIDLDPILPGIRGLFAFRPETAKPLSDLAHVLLHEENSLSRAERELIATYVSHLNDCFYCQTSHGAIAAYHLGGNDELVRQVKTDAETAAVSEKLKSLLKIAAEVQKGGKMVSSSDVQRARSMGATDLEIHDTVLIATRSACTTDMLTDLRPGRHRIRTNTKHERPRWLKAATEEFRQIFERLNWPHRSELLLLLARRAAAGCCFTPTGLPLNQPSAAAISRAIISYRKLSASRLSSRPSAVSACGYIRK
jgi:uncharacterized peroxidase-related enzyme